MHLANVFRRAIEMQRQLLSGRVVAAAESLRRGFPQHFRASLLVGRDMHAYHPLC